MKTSVRLLLIFFFPIAKDEGRFMGEIYGSDLWVRFIRTLKTFESQRMHNKKLIPLTSCLFENLWLLG